MSSKSLFFALCTLLVCSCSPKVEETPSPYTEPGSKEKLFIWNTIAQAAAIDTSKVYIDYDLDYHPEVDVLSMHVLADVRDSDSIYVHAEMYLPQHPQKTYNPDLYSEGTIYIFNRMIVRIFVDNPLGLMMGVYSWMNTYPDSVSRHSLVAQEQFSTLMNTTTHAGLYFNLEEALTEDAPKQADLVMQPYQYGQDLYESEYVIYFPKDGTSISLSSVFPRYGLATILDMLGDSPSTPAL